MASASSSRPLGRDWLRRTAAEANLARPAAAATFPPMSITATVHNDPIKLPPGVHLPDGTQVTVEPRTTVAERLAAFIGLADDLPPGPGRGPRRANW